VYACGHAAYKPFESVYAYWETHPVPDMREIKALHEGNFVCSEMDLYVAGKAELCQAPDMNAIDMAFKAGTRSNNFALTRH
jgi:hypothetical protein